MSIISSIKDYFSPQPIEEGLRVRDVIRELPSGAKTVGGGILGALQKSGQSFFRGTAALSSFATNKTLTPSTPFQKELYGTDKPITPTSYGQEFGLKGIPAAIGGVVIPSLDLIPGGKIAKSTAVKVLQDTSDITSVKNVLRGLMGMSDEVSQKYAPWMAKTRNPVQLSKLVDRAIEESQSVSRITNKVKTTLKERKFITSARKVIPEADKLSGQYIPRDTTQLAIKARNLVNDDIFTAKEMVMSGDLNDKTVAVASELIKKLGTTAKAASSPAEANAYYDEAALIANKVARELTESGRTIQAASILGRLTPEGQLRFAAREIQKYNEANPLKKIPELSGQQANYITKETEAIAQMPDGLEKSMRIFRLQNYVQDLAPTPLMKKLTAVWKAGLLTGIKTFGLNLFSNATHFVSEVVKDIPASFVDSAAALFTGERTKVATMRGAFDGIKEGSIKGVRYFSTGFDERNIGAKIDYKRVNFGKGVVAKAFQTYTDTVFRALAVGDQPFYYATVSRSLMDQALAQGKNQGLKGAELVKYAYKIVEEPTEDMIRIATADASTAVFINQTIAGQAAAKIQSLPGGEFIIPFGRTPSAVAMQAIAYSPVGIAATIVKNIGKGKFNQRAFSEGIGRGLTGTAVMYIGMQLAEKGLFSKKYPIGDEKEQKLREAEGEVADRVLIDGKWRNPLVLGPAGTVLQAGAHLHEAIQKNGSPSEAMVEAIYSTGSSFLELPFLTGLQDFTNALMDPARYAKGYLPGLIASFVPTILSDVAQSLDDVERRAGTTVERIKSRIPGVRETLEPRVSILGEDVARKGNPLETMLDPTRPSNQMETPVTMEFRRLHNQGYRVSPTTLGNKNGYDVLTPEQNTKLWKMTGTIIDNKLTNLFASDKYINLPDDQKAKVIESFVTEAKTISRALAVISITEGLTGEELKLKLKELKEGDVLNREVYNKYLELR